MIALTADFHINLSRKDNPFYVHIEYAFLNFEHICTRDVDHVFILGDLFHSKYHVSTVYLNKTNEFIAKLAETKKVYIIRGNHDTASLNELGTNLCENYKYFNNVFVINDYNLFIMGDIAYHCLAYYDDEQLVKMINDIKLVPDKKNILLSHFGVEEFAWHGNKDECDYRIDKKLLSKFDRVFLGHYHGYQTQENIVYVSSPLQQRYGDEDSQHGFVLFNENTMECQFIENDSSPQFVTFEFNKENVKKALSLQNHYIRFIVKQHQTKDALATVKQKILKENYECEYKFDVQSENLSFKTIENWDEIQTTDLDDLLLSYLKQIRQLPAGPEEMLQAILD